jgi:hypothetical protein
MKHRRSLSDQAYTRGLRALSDHPNNQSGANKTWVLHFLRKLERLFKNARQVAKMRDSSRKGSRIEKSGRESIDTAMPIDSRPLIFPTNHNSDLPIVPACNVLFRRFGFSRTGGDYGSGFGDKLPDRSSIPSATPISA